MIDARKLQIFAETARPLLAAQPILRKPLPNATRLATACAALQHGLLAARNAGAFANPWTIAGLERREVRNCAVLARLWDYSIMGLAGRRFLEAILRGADPEGTRGLPSADIADRPYTVLCESCLAGDGANRLDIVIESVGGDGGWTIVVEAKIGAGLGDKQLERYLEELRMREKLTGRKTHLVLLSPRPWDATGDNIAHIRWRYVARAAQEISSHRQGDLTEPEKLIAAFGAHVADFDN